MEKILPDIIKENGFDFWWDNQKVHQLNVPVEQISVIELDWIFDLPFWSNKGVSYCLTPREFINNPTKYPTHKKRIQICDISYPIDIMQNPNGKWLILDGLHRLVKIVMEGKKNVKVRKLPRELIPLIKRVD